MTLTASTNRNDYVGTGITGPYPYAFRILAATDLDVRRYDPVAGVEVPLVLTSDYTVAGVGEGSGGSITLVVALAVGQTLTIRRVRPVTQTTSIRDQGAFLPELHEDAFDHQVMIDQQHEEALGRALQLPVTTQPSAGVSPVLPAPQASKVLGWDATGKKIVNTAPLAGPEGVRGPAGAGGPIPIFTDTVDRDAFFPAPATDNAAIVKSLGYQMRFGAPASGANKWLAEGVTRAAGPVITTQSQGLVANGATDDAPFLTAADAKAVASGGRHELDPCTTRVYINSNITLSGQFRVTGKNAIYVEAGKTLTINGPFSALDHRVFDPTMPGTVSFGAQQPVFNPLWFGVVGDDATDNAVALNFMGVILPHGAAVVWPGGLNIRWRTPWRVAAKLGWKNYVEGSSVSLTSAVNFKWDGDFCGRMLILDHVNGAEFHGGFQFWTCTTEMLGTVAATMTLGAPTTLVDNGPARYHGGLVNKRVAVIGAGVGGKTLFARVLAFVDDHTLTLDTACSTAVSLTRAYIGSVNGLPAACSVDHMGAPNSGNETGQCKIDAGLAILDSFSDTTSYGYETYFYNFFFPDHVARNAPISIPGAGPAGATLNTTIVEWISPTRVRLAAAASTSVNGALFTITGQGGGGGIGSAAVFEDTTFNGGSVGLPELNHNRISVATDQNHEFHRYTKCNFFGGGLGYMGFLGWHVGTTIGSPTITSAGLFSLFGGSANDNKNMIGQRIRIEDAADGPSATAAWDPPSIPAGGTASIIVTVPGATVTPDRTARASFSLALGGLTISAVITAQNKITVTLTNPTGGAIDLGNGTVTATMRDVLDARILSRTDANTITINKNASETIASSYAALGEGVGDMIVVGASANAHGHTIERNNFTQMRRGVDIGSSFVGRSNTFASGGDLGYYLRGNSRPVVLDYDVMEGTGNYFFQVIAGPGALFVRGLAFGMEGTTPQGAVFDFGLGGNTYINGIGYDGTPTNNRPVFRFSRGSGSATVRGTRHYPGTGGVTMQQAGYTSNIQMVIEVTGDLNLISPPSPHFILGGNFSNGGLHVAIASDGDGAGAVTGKYTNRGGSTANRGAVRGHLESVSGAGVSGVLAAVEGVIGQETDGFSSVASAAFRAIMPTFAGFFCNSTHPIHGLLIESPVLSSGFLQQLYGIRLKAQTGTGVSGVHGIWQEGTSDPNLFAGVTSFGSGRVEMATVYIDIAAGGNATPNASGAEVYRYRIAGAATVNKPLNLLKGMRFKLIIFNNTGGAITPTLNGAFLVGFGAIGANKSRSRDYVYDDVLDKLEPIGAVSEDF